MTRALPLDPPLAPSHEEWRELRLALDPVYERYVTEVSDRVWAASLETSALLWHLCRSVRASRVLEFGSGFTSYVFRRYADETDMPVRVLTVEHDPEWLTKTAGFLTANGISRDGLADLQSFDEVAGDDRFDVVFQDLGVSRDQWIPTAVARAAPEGLIVLDDANQVRHRRALMKAGFAAGRSLYDLRPWTTDFPSRARWALMVK